MAWLQSPQESSQGVTIMSGAEEANSRRAEIASRNRRRILEARERKLSMAMFGPGRLSCAGQSGVGGLRRRGPVMRECRSEEHTSELQSLMRISYAVFC